MTYADRVTQTLDTWHEILSRNAMEELDPILSDRIVFRSPVTHTPYPGREAIKVILKNVNTVFEDFEYHRTFFTADHSSVTLEFTARIEDKRLTGVDILKFDAEGKIEEFVVMVRPLSGLQMLAKHMGEKLAPHKDMIHRIQNRQ